MIEKFKQYYYLTRLHKPIGIFLLLWPTLWALWLAGQGRPNMFIVMIFVLGVIVMRSAGCVINDFADRHFDGHVARTRTRPLVTGKITPKESLVFFVILLMIAFLLVLTLNRFTILLAFAAVIFATVYPFMKRYTHLPQAGLGIAFAWSVPMAFAAQSNTLHWRDGLVFLAAFIWPLIYDTFYAMADREEDLKIGLKSTAILFGTRDKMISGILQIVFLFLLFLIGIAYHLTVAYYLSISFAAMLFLYQQFLIRDNDPQQCFQAFINNHWVGFAVFVGILLNYENCCR